MIFVVIWARLQILGRGLIIMRYKSLNQSFRSIWIHVSSVASQLYFLLDLTMVLYCIDLHIYSFVVTMYLLDLRTVLFCLFTTELFIPCRFLISLTFCMV